MMRNNSLLNGEYSRMQQTTRKECPVFIAFLAVACTVFAGLGDWNSCVSL